MPNGEVKAKDILVLGTSDQHRVIVYTTDPETGVTLLRSISAKGRIRFNGWWRLKMKFKEKPSKDDEARPLWWDEAAKSVTVPELSDWQGDPKDKTSGGFKSQLVAAGFILVEVAMNDFLDRKYDVED